MSDDELTYEEFGAPGVLADHVRCIWHLRGNQAAGSGPEPIVPDGCAEVVLNLADPFARHETDGTRYHQPLALCAGQLSRAIRIQPTGRVDIWGIRFQPWSAARLLESSASELRDRVPSLEEVSRPLHEAIEHVRDVRPAARHDALVQALTRRVSSVESPPVLLRAAVTRIMTANEPMTVRMLAKELGGSMRNLQALFDQHVGLSPKLLMRIARFQRALGGARANPSLSWAAVAQSAGYFDQAHLVHDSQDLAGCTPSALTSNERALTEAFLAE